MSAGHKKQWACVKLNRRSLILNLTKKKMKHSKDITENCILNLFFKLRSVSLTILRFLL